MLRFLSYLTSTLIIINISADESLPLLTESSIPQTVNELWANYDSTKESLEAKTIQEWQEDGITIRYITYTIGTFKGRKSVMAGYYAFPHGSTAKIPALIQMHGGGQRASVDSAKYGAENGYACLSINWGGRPLETAKSGDPGTDWGAVDATQEGHNSHYESCEPDDRTIDIFESPRNNNWFLIIIAAKRGITFLEKQPEVDKERIGAFGHSMGGRLTVMLAGSDKRIRVGVPSCGGCGSAPDIIRNRKDSGVRPRRSDIYHKTIDDAQYIREVNVPMLYVGPHNDFNGILDNMYANWKHMPSKTINYTVTPHMNHRAIPEHSFSDILFFEDHLKGNFNFPATPELKAWLETSDGIPRVEVIPDQVEKVSKIDVYYSIDSHILTRFWRTAESTCKGDTWEAACPIMSADQHLFIMANVYYRYDHKIVGYRWSRGQPDTFGISSEMITITPAELKKALVKAEFKHEKVIERSFDDYHDWYLLDWSNPVWWGAYTRKIKDPMWAGYDGAKLLLDVKTENDITIFVEIENNSWGAYAGQKKGQYYAQLDIKGSDEWQTLSVLASDFMPANKLTKDPLKNWKHITELGIRGRMRLKQDDKQVELGGSWTPPRQFRNLRWEGGSESLSIDTSRQAEILSDEEFKTQFQKGIDDSIELERKDVSR